MRLPSRGASELDWLRYEQAGVLTWRQATRLLSPGKVRSLVKTGRWQRPCRGVLVTHSGSLEPLQQVWVAVLAAGRYAVLAGLAAARVGGLRRVRSQRGDAIDVYLPVSRQPPDLLHRLPAELPAVFVHRTTQLPRQDLQRGRPMRTSMERSLVDAARWAITNEEARRIIAAGCQQRRVVPADVLEVVDRMPNLRRRALIRETAYDLAGGAEALSRSISSGCAAGSACRPRPIRNGARTLPEGFATSTRTGRSGTCTSRWTAATTWRWGSGRRICAARTTSGSRATGFCGSRRSRPGIDRPESPSRSAARC